MKRIFLHGYLGRMFGKYWNLDVKSVKEAMEAININTKGKFRKYFLTKGRSKLYYVKLGNYITNEPEELCANCGESTDIHIFPYVYGQSGVVKIIVGIVLIVVGVLAKQPWMIKVGVSLIIGGIVTLLTPIPNWGGFNAGEQGVSNIFDGNGLIANQGFVIPIVYGRMAVNPIPISVSLRNEDRSKEQYAGGWEQSYSNQLSTHNTGIGQFQYSFPGQFGPNPNWPLPKPPANG